MNPTCITKMDFEIQELGINTICNSFLKESHQMLFFMIYRGLIVLTECNSAVRKLNKPLPYILGIFVPAVWCVAWFAEFQETFKGRLRV